ncbi:acylamino-acid-releasing enzyme [Halalkalicoccus paucihalophilus]|uniref:Acylamino-acid-releasing enzyme n=1 Tax=Halalkalicoccus paucihalophilus TaxID=1008153 RepID=A0A151AI68_9EURY|nr:S9 family peptidase [Halalkalicoccus paucihalophilus]KYH27097.1 acylamino-acid-releasing enzyme [Halalkalicoccus paucihalophilus]
MQTISASDYHDLVRVGDPRLSPDGERVAFVRTTPRGAEETEATIYTVPLGGDEPRRFTLAEGVDSEPRWSPSGDRLAFVSTRGEDDRPQLWIAPTGGGEARRITDVVGGVSQIAWGPDGERIAFTQASSEEDRGEGRDLELEDEEYEPEAPDPRVIDRLVYRAGERYFDGGRSHVYLAEMGGEVTRLTGGDFDYVAPEWGNPSTLYYAAKRTDDPDDNAVHDVIAHDLDGDESEVLIRTSGWAIGLAATADGRVAYHHTPDGGSTLRRTEIRMFDRGLEKESTLTESLDRTVEGVPKWGPDGEYLYFLTPDEGDVVLRRVRGDGTGLETVVRNGHIDGFDPGRNAVAMTKSEWDHPGDVFVSTPAGAETNRLTRMNREYLTDRAVPQPEELWFESEGEEVQGWVLAPPDMEEGERYPLVVEIHGGPHAMWSTAGTMWHEFQTLAARGYVVFWCNPRGSTGYGEEFMAAIERDWGAVTARDVLAGAGAVCEREYVDETNQFVTGGSFGGYMTGWLVGHTNRFDGAVAQRGVYDLSSFYGSTDAFKLVEWDFGTEPWDDPEFLWDQSPVAYASEVETPTLVIHSDNDFRVPVNNGEMFYLFLKKNGVETRLVRYPREGHELSRSGEPGHVVDRIERLARWFDGYSEHHDAPRALDQDGEGLSADGDPAE